MSDIKRLDPIQGLIDYIQDIKPYHTKIVEVLTEYVHSESIVVRVKEILDIGIEFKFPNENDQAELEGDESEENQSNTFDTNRLGAYGDNTTFGVGDPPAWPVIPTDFRATSLFDTTYPGYDRPNKTIILPLDRTAQYYAGSKIEVIIYNAADEVQNSKINEIVSAEFIPQTSSTNIPHTKLVLKNTLTNAGTYSSNPPTELYVTATLTPFPIESTIEGYGDDGSGGTAVPINYTDVPEDNSTVPLPTPHDQMFDATESFFGSNYVNSFVFAGDVTRVFIPTAVTSIEGTNKVFHVLFSRFENNKTYVRVVEDIPPGTNGRLKLQEFIPGFGEVLSTAAINVDGASTAERITNTLPTIITDSIVFSWSDTGQPDVINGFQYIVQSSSGSKVYVNGEPVGVVRNGDEVQFIDSPGNTGTFVVTKILGNEITLDRTVSNAEGKYIESI